MPSLTEAKERLDLIIDKGRVDLYKPIQIAEVLRRSRVEGDIKVSDLATYKNPSIYWRNEVTTRLLGKCSSSSAQYQHDVWNPNAMAPQTLVILDEANKKTNGLIERYIYSRFTERQETVAGIFTALQAATPENFKLEALLNLFVRQAGIRRSVDKAYEIVTYALFETVVRASAATIQLRVSEGKRALLSEFQDLAEKLLGLKPGEIAWEQAAHIYRVGVTNAADRGLDMWANFGPAIQVKHLILDEKVAEKIVDQVESDRIVVVCRDADASVIRAITKQIGWGKRVCGIVVESDLVKWYEKCLRGRFAAELAQPLMTRLLDGFQSEFPQISETAAFMQERGYDKLKPVDLWRTETDLKLAPTRL